MRPAGCDKGFRVSNTLTRRNPAFSRCWTGGAVPVGIGPVTKKQPRAALDDVSKAIIEQLQADGRRSYAAIGKVVGLSEAAVRQRVQRLIDAGVMQVVAVTDPLELGSPGRRWSASGSTGRWSPCADALADLEEVDYVVDHGRRLRPPGRGRLRERRAPARGDLGQDPPDLGCRRDRDLHVPQAAQADLLVGCALSTGPAALLAPTIAPGSGTSPPRTSWTPRPALPGDRDADVAIVGAGFTGLWTALYLARADPSLRIAVLEARDRGLRRERPQRRLVLRAVPVLARVAGQALLP